MREEEEDNDKEKRATGIIIFLLDVSFQTLYCHCRMGQTVVAGLLTIFG